MSRASFICHRCRTNPDQGHGLQGVENIFFFNSLRDALDWELVIRCDPNAVGTWKLNGHFYSVANLAAS